MRLKPGKRWLASMGLAGLGVVAVGVWALWSVTCTHPAQQGIGGSAGPPEPRAERGSGPGRSAAAPSPDMGRFAATAPAEAAQPPRSEEELMARLRAEVDRNPALALQLVRLAEARYPDGRLADERSWLKMRALVHRGDIAMARDEAALFFRRHPHSPFLERVHRLTGMHPRPRPGPRR